jgi:hypothetical protein
VKVERSAALALGLIAVACVVGLFVIVGGRFLSLGTPSSEDVVLAFQDEGLEVGDFYPVEQEPEWNRSPVPKTYEEGTRFEIPSLGRDSGGRVFVFKEHKDLEVMRDYYVQIEEMPVFGPSLHSHLYTDGLVLLQINGALPKTQADRYGKVLQEKV